MRDHSAEMAAELRGSHTPVNRVKVISEGKIVRELEATHSATVNGSRLGANMFSFDLELSDPTGELTPRGITDLLAPGATRIQLERGVRLSSDDTKVSRHNSVESWQTSGVTTLNVTSGGVLTLGA